MQFSTYFIPMAFNVVISGWLSYYGWRKRSSPCGKAFALLMASVAEWSLAYALELAAPDLNAKIIWSKLHYIGVVGVPLAWIILALEYTNLQRYLTRRNLFLLSVQPLIMLVLVFTNEWHHLIWATTTLDTSGSLDILAITPGDYYVVNTIYSYTLLLFGVLLLIRQFIRADRLYRGQVGMLILAVLVGMGGNALYQAGVNPEIELTSLAFTVTGAILAWGLFRYKLLDVVPIARAVLIESMGEGVIVLDEQGRIVDINPAAQAVIGRKHLIGEPIQYALSKWPSSVFAQVENGGKVRTEIALEAGVYLDVYITPLEDHRGQRTGRLVVFRDVTSRKEAEQALRQYADELEERNRELDAYTHTIAHDLKAPLTVMLGYANLFQMQHSETFTPEARRQLALMISSGQKMTEMIDQLLWLAKVRDAASEAVRVDVEPLIKGALQRFEHLIHEAGITVEVAPDALPVLGHAAWVEEVFANLIGNAIKYMGSENPAPHILIRCTREDTCVRYEVIDTGIGIPADQQKTLFEMFTRVHTLDVSGFGLGLAIVQRIVTRLNGQVGVQSAPGQGSIFWFKLPAA